MVAQLAGMVLALIVAHWIAPPGLSVALQQDGRCRSRLCALRSPARYTGSSEAMKLSRPSRISSALIALISMLFMQLAVAAYACPKLPAAQTVADDMQGMEDCELAMAGDRTLDAAAPNLCHAHCHVVQLSADQTPTAYMPALSTTHSLLIAVELEGANQSSVPRSSLLRARAIGPPLAIRNCCFRI